MRVEFVGDKNVITKRLVRYLSECACINWG